MSGREALKHPQERVFVVVDAAKPGAFCSTDLASGYLVAILGARFSKPKGVHVNKAELVEKLAKRTGLTKKDARAALDGVVDVVTAALAKNEPVIITGFGKFETRKRKATTRMNPQTGQRIKTPAKTVPAFKAGKNLKELVAKKAG